MAPTKFSRLIPLSLALSLGLAIPVSASIASKEAAPVRLGNSFGGEIPNGTLNAYDPPGDLDLPGRREGGGTRGNHCAYNRLTALVPNAQATEENSVSVYGATAADAPTLYFYLEANAEAQSSVETTPEIEFVLQKVEGGDIDASAPENIYIDRFEAPAASGILEYTIDPSKLNESLEMGEFYVWYFSVICEPADRSNDLFTSGWLQRTDVSVDGLNPEQRQQAYRDAAVWYDALAEAKAMGATEQWTTLLEQVGLGEYANASIISAR